MAKTSGNTKGNKYHADDGQFTFAPYQNYKYLESTVKTKILPARQKFIDDLNAGNLNNKRTQKYLDLINEERTKLQKENGATDEQIAEAHNSINRWVEGFGMESGQLTIENVIDFDNPAIQADIALAQSIIKEGGNVELTRVHCFNIAKKYYDFGRIERIIPGDENYTAEGNFINGDNKTSYVSYKDERLYTLNETKGKSFSANSNPNDIISHIGAYRYSPILAVSSFTTQATPENIVFTPDILISSRWKQSRESDFSYYMSKGERDLLSTQREYVISNPKMTADKATIYRMPGVDSTSVTYDVKTGKLTDDDGNEVIPDLNSYAMKSIKEQSDYYKPSKAKVIKSKNSLSLNAHFSNDGVIDDYGQYIESKLTARKQQFLAEIKSIQFEAINNASLHLVINEFSEDDITTKEERKTIFDKLYEAIKKYWLFLVPVIGSYRLQEDEKDTGYKRVSPINLLGTSWIQKDVDKNAKKAATSHTDTIFKTIVEAGKKAEEKIFSRLFADRYKKKYDENPEEEKKFFKTEPTITQIKSKLKNPEFVSKNQDIIDFVRKEIEEGKHVQEIQREIRSKYSNLSNGRVKTLVNTETSRATVRSQYDADYEFLKNIGKLDKAYKVLESNTGDPCPICAALISKGEIPFTKEFVELGDSVTVTEGDKSITMTFDYEAVEAGCVHPNCHCSYRLIIK